jgi:hypothetical protein
MMLWLMSAFHVLAFWLISAFHVLAGAMICCDKAPATYKYILHNTPHHRVELRKRPYLLHAEGRQTP